MKLNRKKILVCDCEGTMPLDGKALAKACENADAPEINTQLCRAQIENFTGALDGDAQLVVACTQEAPLFAETAAEAETDPGIVFTNIRERAGWSEDAKKATPKIAALLAEAALDIPAAKTVTMVSAGVCLVYGKDEAAIEAALQLATRLDVTVLLDAPGALIPPRVTEVPVFQGTIAKASGHLGAFEVTVQNYAALSPSSRGAMSFEAANREAASRCDLILDLTGGAPLFPGHEKRDGYLRPDPGNPAAVQRALFDLADMVGEFEKPRYVDYDPDICAHSRSKLTGCTNCLDACPASAIQPAGDTVEINPYVCGGCGACHSVCPTGAASYALPSSNTLLERLRTLLSAYRKAGGAQPVVLMHDREHGEEMISLMARFGRGLPAHVLPFAVNEVTQIGLEALASALAFGTGQIRILVPPGKADELTGLEEQVALAEAILTGLGYGDGRVALMQEADPEAVGAALWSLPKVAEIEPGSFLPMGGKRTLMLLALGHLQKAAPVPVDLLPLPAGAPFGSIEVDTQGCTMCLACVGACPAGALHDNEERPQLGITESACVQCGLCQATCPEKVITLTPRLNFADAARGMVVVNEDEPFHCVRCGKPYGSKRSIERIVDQLGGKHSMFQDPATVERIKMCEDCRVVHQFEGESEVMAGPKPRPIPRTTDDYLREREEAKAKAQAGNGKSNGSGEG